MYLSEYQAKEILAQYGVSIPEGRIAGSPDEAEACAREIRCEKYVIKAQISAGGRGMAGGIKFAATPSGVRSSAAELIGKRLVTEQTGPAGEEVEQVYVEAAVDIDRSLYAALVIDQRTALPTLLGAREGGIDFEANAGANPDILETLALSVDGALDDAGIAGFLDRLGLSGDAAASVKELLAAAIRAFFATDASLVEINPLAITPDHRAIAVDAKMVIDGNALARHPELDPFVREAPIEESERIARENEINFIKMDGDIGMVVNGAGLGLATHDMVIDAGGRPANFMDIRTTASSFQIAKVVGLLLADPSIKVILVNIHGGGMTVCDTVAEAIGFAYARSDRRPPIVYRAAGQNAPWSLSIMKDRRLPFEKFDDMTGAVARAVAVAKSGAR